MSDKDFLMIDKDELVMIFTSEKVPLLTEDGKRGMIYDKHDENNVIVHPGNLDALKAALAEEGTGFLVVGEPQFPFEDWDDCPKGVR